MNHPDIDLAVSCSGAINARDPDHYRLTQARDVAYQAVGRVTSTGIDAVPYFGSIWLKASSDFHLDSSLIPPARARRMPPTAPLAPMTARCSSPRELESPHGHDDRRTVLRQLRGDGKFISEFVYLDRMMIAEQVGLAPIAVR